MSDQMCTTLKSLLTNKFIAHQNSYNSLNRQNGLESDPKSKDEIIIEKQIINGKTMARKTINGSRLGFDACQLKVEPLNSDWTVIKITNPNFEQRDGDLQYSTVNKLCQSKQAFKILTNPRGRDAKKNGKVKNQFEKPFEKAFEKPFEKTFEKAFEKANGYRHSSNLVPSSVSKAIDGHFAKRLASQQAADHFESYWAAQTRNGSGGSSGASSGSSSPPSSPPNNGSILEKLLKGEKVVYENEEGKGHVTLNQLNHVTANQPGHVNANLNGRVNASLNGHVAANLTGHVNGHVSAKNQKRNHMFGLEAGGEEEEEEVVSSHLWKKKIPMMAMRYQERRYSLPSSGFQRTSQPPSAAAGSAAAAAAAAAASGNGSGNGSGQNMHCPKDERSHSFDEKYNAFHYQRRMLPKLSHQAHLKVANGPAPTAGLTNGPTDVAFLNGHH